MHFKNNTGDKSLDHWRTMLADLLISDLAQSKYIDVLSGERLWQILKELDQLEATAYSFDILNKVAKQGGCNHLLVGNYAKAGDTIRIHITVQEARTKKIIGSEKAEGKGEENIFPIVDDLTRKIKTHFNLSKEEILGDIDKEIGTILTSSPEAYRLFSEAKRSILLKGDNREAIHYYEKALAIDPGFARAYSGIGSSLSNLGYKTEARKYSLKAFELKDRLSDRENYFIQGNFYGDSEKTYDRAIEAYHRLLELYPDDMGANNNLGYLYVKLEEWDKAQKYLEVNIRNKTKIMFTKKR